MNRQLELLSVCASDGTLTPLRFRMEDDAHCLQTVVITKVISYKSIQYAGIDAIQYLCKAHLSGKERLFELRYFVKTHSWSLFRTVY